MNQYNYHKLLEKLLDQKRLFLTTHLRPDDDGLGAELALNHVLTIYNKDSLIFNEEELSPSYASQLDGRWTDVIYSKYSIDPSMLEDRTVVVLDNSSLKRIGSSESYILPDYSNLIVIDHHDDHLIDYETYFIYPQASATCEIISELYEIAGCDMPLSIARLLYKGIVADTGYFRYPKTSSRTHQITARLIEAGVKPSSISEEEAQRWSLHRLYARRLLYNNLRITMSGKVAYTTARIKDLQKEGIQLDDLQDIVNELLEVQQVKVAMIFTERDTGNTKVSLRSRSNTDLLSVVEKFGGGGHPTACAALVPTQLDAAIQCILPLVEELLAKPVAYPDH